MKYIPMYDKATSLFFELHDILLLPFFLFGAWDEVVYDHICWQNNLATIYGTGTVNTKTSVEWSQEKVCNVSSESFTLFLFECMS